MRRKRRWIVFTADMTFYQEFGDFGTKDEASAKRSEMQRLGYTKVMIKKGVPYDFR